MQTILYQQGSVIEATSIGAQEKACRVRHRQGLPLRKHTQDVEVYGKPAPLALRNTLRDSGCLPALIIGRGIDQLEHLAERLVGVLDRPVQLDDQLGKADICKRPPIDHLFSMA
jgi:hypothetical protein